MLSEPEQLWWLLAAAIGLIVAVSIAYISVKRKRHRTRAREKTVDATRYVILNETGNILITSSLDPAKKLPGHVERSFLEAVSSLCLITRAISTTIDPSTGRPYSIYNHFALERVLTKHPLFAPLGQESAEYKIRRNKDFVAQSSNDLFGVGDSEAAQRKISSIYNSMFVAAQIMGEAGETKDARVGHLTLCCEHLMGIPIITAVLMHISYDQCKKLAEHSAKSRWNWSHQIIRLRKDTYLFNSPSLQNEFGADIKQLLLKARSQQLTQG